MVPFGRCFSGAARGNPRAAELGPHGGRTSVSVIRSSQCQCTGQVGIRYRREVCSLAPESALWPSRKVSGPRLPRFASSSLPNICSSVEMSAIRYGRSDHPALRGHNGRPGLRFSRFVGGRRLCPGHRLDCAGPAGVDRPGLMCRPAGLRGGAAGLGEVAGLCVLTLAGDRISATTGFTDNSVLARFSCPAPSPNSLRAGFKAGPVPAVAPRWLTADHTGQRVHSARYGPGSLISMRAIRPPRNT